MSKSKEKKKRRGLVEYLSVKAELPSDALVGETRIELRGRSCLFIQGCRRILKYSPCHMILEVKGDCVSVKGERLVCTSYHAGTVSVEGLICSLCFSEREDAE